METPRDRVTGDAVRLPSVGSPFNEVPTIAVRLARGKVKVQFEHRIKEKI